MSMSLYPTFDRWHLVPADRFALIAFVCLLLRSYDVRYQLHYDKTVECYHHVTFNINRQCLWDYDVKFARWQHPATGWRPALAMLGSTCSLQFRTLWSRIYLLNRGWCYWFFPSFFVEIILPHCVRILVAFTLCYSYVFNESNVHEELGILESRCLSPMGRNSVLEELRVRRLAVIQEERSVVRFVSDAWVEIWWMEEEEELCVSSA